MKWKEIIESFTFSDDGKKLKDKISKERDSGVVHPKPKEIFAPFSDKMIEFNDVKIIIINDYPYSDGSNKGLGICRFNGKKSDIIDKLFNNLKNDLYSIVPENIFNEWFPDGDLSSWYSKGVLMFSRILTCNDGDESSHKNIGWEKLTNKILMHLMEDEQPKVVIDVCKENPLNKDAFKKYNDKHLVLSYEDIRCFSKAFSHLGKNNRLERRYLDLCEAIDSNKAKKILLSNIKNKVPLTETKKKADAMVEELNREFKILIPSYIDLTLK